MSEYIPILIIDEDDTSRREKMSLREFLEEIDMHVKNFDGATLDNVIVNLKTETYEDDDSDDLCIAEISFSVKK